jgi:ATP-dependent Clp protease ATP-binding subunit ClpA
MPRFSDDVRRRVFAAATEEAQRRGDRRIGTDHLLLGLLRDPDSLTAQTLGVDLAAARAASATLDREALAAVGIDAGQLDPAQPVRTRRTRSFTSGARSVLIDGVTAARSAKSKRIEERHMLLGVLSRERPDPAAELLAALGVDAAEARARLRRPSP